MGVFLESWLSELVAVALVTLAAVYTWYAHRYTYWKSKGVPQAAAAFPFGNVRKVVLGQTRLEFLVQDIYKQFKGQKYVGIYALQTPLLVILDPDIIRLVMVKEFDAFQDRNVAFDEEDPMNQHLFFLSGQKWKILRSKLSPTFTTGKLKMMCETMQNCGREMVEVLDEAARREEVLEMREIAGRFTTDIIASVAFGIECHCQSNPDAEFRQWARKIFEPGFTAKLSKLMYGFIPIVAKAIRFPNGMEHITAYFYNVVKDTVEYREKNNVSRNDFLNLLIQLKNKGIVDDERGGSHRTEGADHWKLSIEEVISQALLFFAAGFDTSSMTMSFALYELALHPEIQRRLQDEVDRTLQKADGQLTYETIAEMPYLDKVVAETLRKYVPGALDRRCTRRFQFPDGGPVVEEGMTVLIPMYAIHHDPEYFPDPERFDPERFTQEQKALRHPYVYLPFGEGPRNCIGMRLALLQTKIGLAYMMSKFEVQRCERTMEPLRYLPFAAVLTATEGLHLRLVTRKQ